MIKKVTQWHLDFRKGTQQCAENEWRKRGRQLGFPEEVGPGLREVNRVE